MSTTKNTKTMSRNGSTVGNDRAVTSTGLPVSILNQSQDAGTASNMPIVMIRR